MDSRTESMVVGADTDQRNGTANKSERENEIGKDEDVNSIDYDGVGYLHKSDLFAEKSQLLDDSLTNTNAEATRPSTSTKGFGLKKWRRIRRRDHVIKETEAFKEKEKEKEKEKDRDSDSDSTGRMLKRGSANILNENNDGSSSTILPTTATMATIPIPIPVTSAFVNNNAAATFNAGADSDNSEDSHSHRSSSKSSTKAQGHNHHHPRDKNRIKYVSAKNFKLGKSQPQPDPSKKARGGNLDKESSPLSSLESDSRSCNSHFVRPSSHQIHILTPHPLRLDGEDSLPSPPPSEHQRSPAPSQSSDQLSSSANQGKSKEQQFPGDSDPLVDSILMLQAAQIALQTELQKFGEIGKGICSLYDDSDKTIGVAVHSMSADPLVYMDRASKDDGWNEFNHGYLSKIVQTLERQLNEAEGNLKEKEHRIAELETTISRKSPQDSVRSAMEQQYKQCIEMEAELQDLFKQKLEAEVQSVVITRSTKELSVLVDKKFAESPRTMVDVDNKEKSDTLSTGEEIVNMQRGVVKFTKCLVMQLVLLVLVFALFMFQLVPKSAEVVPT